MDTPEGQSSPNLDHNSEPYFDDLVVDFNAKDSSLLMSYARRIEHPNQKSMQDLNDALESTEEGLMRITRKLIQGDMGNLDERSDIIVQIFDELIKDRKTLFSEYVQLSSKPAAEKLTSRDEFIAGINRSILDSPEAFRDEMLKQFYAVITTDAAIIDTIIEHHPLRTLRHNIGPLALKGSKEIIKIGSGVAIGMMVANRFIRK